MKYFIPSFLLIYALFSQVPSDFRPVHTYSIVAHDPATGQLGVAVQSHWFSVGVLVPWAKAGVGAVATQSFVKVEYGPDGLKLMEQGFTAGQALKKLVSTDDGEAVRQVAMIDIHGNVAAHTGKRCIYAAGDQQGKNYSVQANLMEHETVWPAMAEAFESFKLAILHHKAEDWTDISCDEVLASLDALKNLTLAPTTSEM